MASFYIACLNPDLLVRMEWAMAFAAKNWPMASPVQIGIKSNYMNIDHARNVAIADAAAADYDFVFFWDDDVVPRTHNGAGRMAQMISQPENANVTVLGGIYPRRTPGFPEPIVTKSARGAVWWQPVRDGKLHRVYMTGTGFTIFRVKDLLEMDVPTYRDKERRRTLRQYFNAQAGYPGRNPEYPMRTDDFYVAEVLREAGKEWWVDGSVICDQVDRDGTRYRIEDAAPQRAAE